ncbi:c-type cytochrome [Parvicella tangerina]|uniref:Cytochrome c domain-containing protein n=1 Tax=Parvicella tangerina TaxID=2829795 RepID=A0A916NF81_9FLAO|nr:c-type cytochrome [Parvicella tangerina]CAG5077893.1 hypothetical protein CRYO30217_00509 [Parvicella tangerina]
MAIFSRNSKLVLIFSIFVLASCEEPASAESIGEEMSAEKIYLQKCVSCHGKNGDLGVSGAADLSKSQKSLEAKMKTIEKGGPNGIMQAYGVKYGGTLTDDQLHELAEYVETLAK